MAGPLVPGIFVFGSNRRGIHGAGAALHARAHYGAVTGDGEGRRGRSYALPTKDFFLNPVSTEELIRSIETFLTYARAHPQEDFYVTRIGCGLAGFSESAVAPLFAHAPKNCILPSGWRTMNKQPEDDRGFKR